MMYDVEGPTQVQKFSDSYRFTVNSPAISIDQLGVEELRNTMSFSYKQIDSYWWDLFDRHTPIYTKDG